MMVLVKKSDGKVAVVLPEDETARAARITELQQIHGKDNVELVGYGAEPEAAEPVKPKARPKAKPKRKKA